MGACLSCRRKSPTFESVRVVHLNGYVEEFEHPITVGEITGKLSKHFICTPAQLLMAGSKPLKPDTLLEPRKVYLLLPYSTLRADVSPLDLAAMAGKLTQLAKTSRLHPKSPAASPLNVQPAWNSPMRCSSPAWNSPLHGSSPAWRSPLLCSSPTGKSPVRCSSPGWNSPARSPSRGVDFDVGLMTYGSQRSPGRSWRPFLDTIREKSFNQRSESDLQETHAGSLL